MQAVRARSFAASTPCRGCPRGDCSTAQDVFIASRPWHGLDEALTCIYENARQFSPSTPGTATLSASRKHDPQMNTAGLSLHNLDEAWGKNFRSVCVSRDIRLIVHARQQRACCFAMLTRAPRKPKNPAFWAGFVGTAERRQTSMKRKKWRSGRDSNPRPPA